MKDDDYQQCIENISTENYQEILSEAILREKSALKSLTADMLLDNAAKAIVYLKLSDALVNKLEAHHANCTINYTNDSSCHPQKKERITSEIIKTLRADIVKIRTDRNREIARHGGKGKLKKDSDGKQTAKADVKKWWDKWQLNPSLYKNQAAFALAMLDKQDGILKSTKVIENWCTKWKG